MLKEFKKFIARGNVMDLAVGVIVGAAFSAIVTSLVDNILMPIIGVLTGGIDFSTGLTFKVKDAVVNYGAFIQSILDFLIIAFCIFILVKVVNKVIGKEEKKDEKKEEKPAPKAADVVLLEEIRDLLKEQAKENKKEEKDKKKK